MFCPSPPSFGGGLRFGLGTGPSLSAIAVAVATAHIATSMTSPALIQAEGPETAALCTSRIPGHWAGPATPEAEVPMPLSSC